MHEERNLNLFSLCPLRPKEGGGGLKALADTSAKNVFFLDGSPYHILKGLRDWRKPPPLSLPSSAPFSHLGWWIGGLIDGLMIDWLIDGLFDEWPRQGPGGLASEQSGTSLKFKIQCVPRKEYGILRISCLWNYTLSIYPTNSWSNVFHIVS